MIRAVIFDMYETLVTLFECPPYFGVQIAADAGIPREAFLRSWKSMEDAKTTGAITLEEALERILKEYDRYDPALFDAIMQKRIKTKEEAFRHLHPQIIPMLQAIRERNIAIGLISNCFSEEARIIRSSDLFPYFDAVFLSCEQGIKKPDARIYQRCMEALGVGVKECLYIGDGGSFELETARDLGMNAVQAAWYLREGTLQPCGRKDGFAQIERPMDLLHLIGG